MQVKLLRVLQDREIRRVGENRQRRVNVRVIQQPTATSQTTSLAGGSDATCLSFASCGNRCASLRQRPEDLQGLAQILLERVARQMERAINGYTPAALEKILSYSWPAMCASWRTPSSAPVC